MRMIVKRILKGQEGITGLETAIILIAFIMVASVFSYVVLSAGLYASQKAKQAIYAGLQTTMSVVELKGSIFAEMESGAVKYLYLFVGIPAAGQPVDFSSNNGTDNSTSQVIVSYIDDNNLIPSVNWTMQKLSTLNSDDLLDVGELFMLKLDMAGNNITILPSHKFTLELKPNGGPVLSIERTIPRRVNQIVNLN